jgi:hypothetical protein
MKDAQFISELLLLLIEDTQHGFDQEMLDAAYARYDDLEEADVDLDEDEVRERLANVKSYLLTAQEANGCVKGYAGTFAVFYTLWAVIALHPNKLPNVPEFATKFQEFMSRVKELDAMDDGAKAKRLTQPGGDAYRLPLDFLQASKGASTDLTPRARRLDALVAFLKLA